VLITSPTVFICYFSRVDSSELFSAEREGNRALERREFLPINALPAPGARLVINDNERI
jgi:hypothetical protein